LLHQIIYYIIRVIYNRVLAKLGSGALAPPICEAKAITSNEFCKNSNVARAEVLKNGHPKQ
jgi:hypothetical protein